MHGRGLALLLVGMAATLVLVFLIESEPSPNEVAELTVDEPASPGAAESSRLSSGGEASRAAQAEPEGQDESPPLAADREALSDGSGTASVRGQLVSRSSGHPIAGAHLILRSGQSRGKSQVDGSFRIEGVRPSAKPHLLEIRHPLHRSEREILVEGDLDLGLLRLDCEGAIRARVFSPAGDLIPYALLQITRIAWDAEVEASEGVDGQDVLHRKVDRRWTGNVLPRLKAGRYTLVATSPAWSPSDPIEVGVESGRISEVDIVVRAPGRLEGRLSESWDELPETVSVRVFRDGTKTDRRAVGSSVIYRRSFELGETWGNPWESLPAPEVEGGEFGMDLPAGRYEVEAEFVPGKQLRFVDVRSGETTQVSLVAPEASAIGGQVLDSSGQPLQAKVILTDQRQSDLASAESDASGRFRLTCADDRRYFVRAESQGFTPGWIEATSGEQDLELVLTPSAALEGRLLDARGESLAGEVSAYWSGPFSSVRKQATTDESGHFAFEALPAGTLELTGRAEGHVPVEVEVELSPSQSNRAIEIRLPRGGILEGHVLWPDGSAASGVDVSLTAEEATSGRQYVETKSPTGETGEYRLGPALPGRHRLRARSAQDGSIFFVGTTTILAGDVTRRDIELEPVERVRVTGRLIDSSGNGLPEHEVSYFQPERRSTGDAWTDANGEFLLEGVPLGTIRVTVVQHASSVAGDLLRSVRRVVLEESVEILASDEEHALTLTVDTATMVALQGRLVSGGQPVQEVPVLVTLDETETAGRAEGWAVTDARGDFELLLQRSGSGLLRVYGGHPKQPLRAQLPIVVPERPGGRSTFEIPNRRVFGRVERERVIEEETWIVLAPWIDGRPSKRRARTTPTREDGTFEFESVPSGEYTLLAQQTTGLGVRERLTIGAEEEIDVGTVLVRPAGNLILKAVIELPVRGFRLRIAGAGILNEFIEGSPEWGEFFMQLPPGTYTAHLEAEGRSPKAVPDLRVEAGRMTEHKVLFDR